MLADHFYFQFYDLLVPTIYWGHNIWFYLYLYHLTFSVVIIPFANSKYLNPPDHPVNALELIFPGFIFETA